MPAMYFYTPSALFTILIILASFACSFALPLTARVKPTIPPKFSQLQLNFYQSPTAVTVWDAPNLAGVSTNLPATATCEDLGEWENRIRSLMTEAGYRCDFYV